MTYCVVCFGCWVVLKVVHRALVLAFAGHPVPALTTAVMSCGSWVLVSAVPWCGLAIWFTLRRELRVETVVAFTIGSALCCVVIAFLVAISCLLPYAGLINE
jgi:hypothetical protein